MTRCVVLLVVCLGLVALVTLPATSIAGEEGPTPGRVADWWLWGDLTLKGKAAALVAEASPDFLMRFQKALTERQGDPDAAAERLIERALASDGEAEILLLGMGPTAIRRLLDRIRQTDTHVLQLDGPVKPEASHQVLIGTAIYSIDKSAVADLLGDAPAERGVHLLDALQVEVLRRALKKSDRAVETGAPRLLVDDGKWATIQTVNAVDYVKAYRVERRGDRVVADPVLDTLEEGVLVEVRPVVSGDARFITLEGYVTRKVVARPIPAKTITLDGVPGEVEIQTPTLAESKMSLEATLPRGGAAVGTGVDDPADPTKEILVVVTANLADPAEFTPDRLERVAADPDKAIVNIEVVALEITNEVVARVLEGRIPDADRPSISIRDRQVIALLGKDLAGTPGVTVVHAPRLSAYDGQRANVSVVNQISFVQDYDLETAKDGSQMADPIIGVLQEGLVLELTPSVTGDRKAIRLDAEATWADVMRPIPEFKAKIGKPALEVTIQLPEIAVVRVKDECRVTPGSWVLLGGLGNGQNGRRFLLLHAQVVDLEEAKGPR